MTRSFDDTVIAERLYKLVEDAEPGSMPESMKQRLDLEGARFQNHLGTGWCFQDGSLILSHGSHFDYVDNVLAMRDHIYHLEDRK